MKIKVKYDDIKTIFGNVAKACSKENSRPVLKAVRLEIEKDQLTAVALNGWFLAQYTAKCTPENGQDEKLEMNVLPDKLAGFDPVLPLTLSNEIPGYLLIEDGQQKQLMRLIDKPYIDWRKVAHAPEGDQDPQPVRQIAFNPALLKLAADIAGKNNTIRMKIGQGLQPVWCSTENGLRMLILPVRYDVEHGWEF